MKSNILLEEKYHDLVAEMYSKRRLRDYIWEVPEELYLLKRRFFKPKIKIVDMGCGPAISVSRILGDTILDTISYTGVDVSKEMLKFAKKNIKNGKFVCHDMSSVIFPQNEFDILLSLGALHHSEDKYLTLTRWLNYVKPGGLLLLREPIYEFLKMGTGESPIEEGIKVSEFLDFVKANSLQVVNMTFFSTNAFHLFNKVMIKIGLQSWQNIRRLWYPVVMVDSYVSRFHKVSKLFDPQAFTIIIKKT